ncbi:MAG: tetratricopeptide repeat protein, partial [Alphaproteobacteria bacterium]
MAHRPEFIAPETRATLFKLLAGVAALSLTTACTPSAKKLLTQSRMPSPVIAQKPPKKPLSPKNPLHVATAYWGKVYQQKPNDPRAAVNYAKNLKAMGSTGKAYAVLKQAALAHPEDREIASELGRLALARGELHLARTYLKMAERTDGKTDWRVLSALGTLNAKQGNHKKAQDYFRAALRKNPGAPSLQNNLALSLAMSGKPAEAEQLLRKTVASGYDTPRVRQNLALVLGLQRKFSEAKQVASLDLPQERVSANIDLLRNIVSTRSLAQIESPAPPSDPGRRLAALGNPAKAKGASDRTGAGT